VVKDNVWHNILISSTFASTSENKQAHAKEFCNYPFIGI